MPWTASGEALALAAGIATGALVSEDGATATAAALAASCALNAKLAFLSVFTGLWVGDLGVYVLARQIGPPILRHRWFARWFRNVNESSGRASAWKLALSRFVPGTRLPCYVTAGFRRMPVLTFALTTAFSAVVWTLLVFFLISWAPSQAAAVGHQLRWVGLLGLAVFAMLTAWRIWGAALRTWLRQSFSRFLRWRYRPRPEPAIGGIVES